MKALAAALAIGVLAQPTAAGAKAMFYRLGTAAATDLRPAPIGIRYWFENAAGVALTADGAAAAGGHYTLHVRANTAGFISIWDIGRGIELLSRGRLSGGSRLAPGDEFAAPDVFELAAAAPEQRLIIVWGRSQTEQAGRVEGAEARLKDLTSRLGRDGAPQIVRESDDVTPGRIGSYVINREGMPVAVELVLRAR